MSLGLGNVVGEATQVYRFAGPSTFRQHWHGPGRVAMDNTGQAKMASELRNYTIVARGRPTAIQIPKPGVVGSIPTGGTTSLRPFLSSEPVFVLRPTPVSPASREEVREKSAGDPGRVAPVVCEFGTCWTHGVR